MSKLKLIYIEWADAISTDEGWRSFNNSIEWGKESFHFVEQVGWILEENEKYLLLASRRVDRGNSKDDKVLQYGDLFKVPKTWIRKRKIIKL